MARFCPLYSGSSGNSSYIGAAGGGVLVDAGVSCRALLTALQEKEIDVDSLWGILITHEHVDHIRGLKVLLKKHQIPIYANAPTLQYLADHDLVPADACLRELDERPQAIGELQVSAFATPHDAVASQGYRIETPDERKLAVATDLGYVSDTVREGITGCDLVLLEANYDTAMLQCSRYPYVLKRRISSDSGHLSNDNCADEIRHLIRTGTTRFVLGHLSKENNLPQLAYQTTLNALDEQGFVGGKDFTLEVAPRSNPGAMTIL